MKFFLPFAHPWRTCVEPVCRERERASLNSFCDSSGSPSDLGDVHVHVTAGGNSLKLVLGVAGTPFFHSQVSAIQDQVAGGAAVRTPAGSCGERKPSTAPCLPFDRHAATTQGGNRNTAEHSEHLCGLAISEMFAEMPFVVKF